MEAEKQPEGSLVRGVADARSQPRFKLAVDISVHSKTSGALKGYTVDISQGGVSAILRLEVPLGEVVELDFTLSSGAVRIYAVVRQRNAFRYGFQFIEVNETGEMIRTTCRELAVAQFAKPPDRP